MKELGFAVGLLLGAVILVILNRTGILDYLTALLF